MFTRQKIVVTLLALGCLCLPARAADETANWTASGGGGQWGNADNWDSAVVPDNDVTGDNWTCNIDNTGSDEINVGLLSDRTVSYVRIYSSGGGTVDLESWNGWRILTLDYLGSPGNLQNYGWLQLDDLEVIGNFANYGYADIDETDIDGDLSNSGSLWFADCEVMGDLSNSGALGIYPYSELWAEGQFTNNGPIELWLGTCSASGTFSNGAAGTLRGSGAVHSETAIANAGSIISFGGSLAVHTWGGVVNTGTISNVAGTSVQVDAASVDHQGKIIVNSAGSVAFNCDLTNKSGASIELLGGAVASPTVTNKAGASFTGFGGVTGNLINEGVIDLYGNSQIVGNVQNAAAATLGIRNGDLLIKGDTVNDGTINAVNGKVYFEGSLTNNGEINMDPSLAVIVGNFTVGANGFLVADAGSTFQMMGDFANASTQATSFDLSAATVQFRRLDGATQLVEVAGEDLGPAAGGWVDNFAFGALLLGGTYPGKIGLLDNADNQLDGPGNEALYVGELSLGAGAAIDLNGRELFYLNGGDPKQFFRGDAKLDGNVDVLDLAALANNFNATDATWARADFNGDRLVDVLDLVILANNFDKVTGAAAGAAPIPEPAAISLLALGLLALARRRRR